MNTSKKYANDPFQDMYDNPVEITSVTWSASPDYETEYNIYADITGTFKGEPFTIQTRRYCVGAQKFSFHNRKEFVEHLIGSEIEESNFPVEDKEDFLGRIFTHLTDSQISEGISTANETADRTHKEWIDYNKKWGSATIRLTKLASIFAAKYLKK